VSEEFRSPVATSSRLFGDPLPDALAAYYVDLDAGRFRDAARHFSDDVVYAIPPAGEIETNPRVVHRGRDALIAWFGRRGVTASAHEVLLCVREGSSCLLEGVSRDTTTGRATASFVASAQLGGDGRVTRYLTYLCTPPADRAPTGDGPAPAAASDVLHDYFSALDTGNFAAAVDRFSDDVMYSHPPYRHTGLDGNDRVVFRGRDELLAAFRARGAQSFDHTILASIQRGPHCLVEGVVQGLADGGGGSFISSLTLDDRGRIRRYLSFYCEPGVPRA
jgi:hypothetical protein